MDNQAVAARFFELYGNQHDVEGVDELFTEQSIIHHDTIPTPLNVESYKQVGYAFLQGFPDLKVEIQDQFSTGDKVVTRVIWSGTHTGDFQGISPTNQSFRADGIVIDHVTEGKIVERWSIGDQLGMMMQLGLLPTPQQ